MASTAATATAPLLSTTAPHQLHTPFMLTPTALTGLQTWSMLFQQQQPMQQLQGGPGAAPLPTRTTVPAASPSSSMPSSSLSSMSPSPAPSTLLATHAAQLAHVQQLHAMQHQHALMHHLHALGAVPGAAPAAAHNYHGPGFAHVHMPMAAVSMPTPMPMPATASASAPSPAVAVAAAAAAAHAPQAKPIGFSPTTLQPIFHAPRAGRWTSDENRRFRQATHMFGSDWKRVSEFVGSRDSAQCRSHAQKLEMTRKRRMHRSTSASASASTPESSSLDGQGDKKRPRTFAESSSSSSSSEGVDVGSD